ncbi:MAG: hypothetical protein U9N49_04290, partial [Campylobacterota bacterium]|nr:hypothetical protein [Campylobacterota bacterium]
MADAVQVSESGVDFGDFLEDDLFQIEKVLSDYVQLGEGINKVEFILKSYYDGTSIVFVEAKSSIPRDSNKFFEEIKSKMIHSITVWFSAVAGRHSKLQDHLPKNHKNLNILKLPIKLILVIPKVP